jgi:hypothetical protein
MCWSRISQRMSPPSAVPPPCRSARRRRTHAPATRSAASSSLPETASRLPVFADHVRGNLQARQRSGQSQNSGAMHPAPASPPQPRHLRNKIDEYAVRNNEGRWGIRFGRHTFPAVSLLARLAGKNFSLLTQLISKEVHDSDSSFGADSNFSLIFPVRQGNVGAERKGHRCRLGSTRRWRPGRSRR